MKYVTNAFFVNFKMHRNTTQAILLISPFFIFFISKYTYLTGWNVEWRKINAQSFFVVLKKNLGFIILGSWITKFNAQLWKDYAWVQVEVMVKNIEWKFTPFPLLSGHVIWYNLLIEAADFLINKKYGNFSSKKTCV